MSESDTDISLPSLGSEVSPVRSVLVMSLPLTVVLGAVSWYIYGMMFARSLLVGSSLVHGSFLLLAIDVRRLARRIGVPGDQQNTVIRAETMRFSANFFARLCVFGLVLFVLTSKVQVHMIALTLGLSTVMCGVVMVGLSKGKVGSSNKV